MKILLTILLLFITELAYSSPVDYGLFIKSYPSENSEFSSLQLENGRPLDMGEELLMSFDMNIREDNIFGLVFRIITSEDENIDLIFTPGDENKRFPMLVVNETTHPLSQEIICNQWIPVSIKLSGEGEQIVFSFGDTKIVVPHSFVNARSARIVFGKSLFEKFEISEIASVNLKDIRIFKDQKLVRFWKLEKHMETVCYDSVKQSPAVVLNPRWLMDNHVNWERLYSGNIPENTLFAFNPQKSEFYIVPDSKEIQIFDTHQKTLNVISVDGGHIAANAPNQLLYDSQRNLLLSYNIDEKTHSVYSFDANRWSNDVAPTQEHRYWNNSACYSPEDSSIISFGGYGFYKYTNELIKLKPYKDLIENTVVLPEIDSRYCSSSVIVDDIMYIFGGRGCKSGRQELFPQYYYDLYAVNLKTLQVRKIWESAKVEVDFLPGENMFYDKDNDCFYVFAIKEKGTLLKIDIRKKSFEEIALPLGEDMEAHYMYANLYYSPVSNKLFALINKTKADKSSSISIYSIAFPPISVDDLYQTKPAWGWMLNSFWVSITVGILILLCVGVIIYRRVKRVRGTRPVSVVEESVCAVDNTIVSPKSEPELPYYDFSRQCIRFLGGFCVKDKDGKDITDQFTPMLKQLFVLLILFTEKNENGIAGNKLIQYLWYDKTEESAKNNRNVYLSKLRVLLEKVGDIEIINKNSSWTIRLGDGVTCDYLDAMRYFTEIMNESSPSRDNLNKLLELLLRGILLPNLETDWVDNFKSHFSSQTIDTLTNLLKDKERNLDNDFKLQIADTIFLHDYINEDALYTKCSILCNSGKRGLAKNIYDNFCKEYYNLLNTEYKHSLSEVINHTMNT